MRAVVYARYSSDLQKLSSIDDQIAACTDFAKNNKFNIVRHFTDAAESGSSLNRAGIQALLNCAKDFDIVVCEALDRLSRDQADIANIFKQLSFSGIKILTLSEGEITSMHIGLKGTMNAMFLEELARKTKRGLKGRIEKGKSGGGKTYGYNVVKQFDSNGEPVRGEREINHHQAEIVNRIFNSYITENKSPKTIAAELNREGIPCPSGAEWGCSTIQGNRRRGTGILNNELYIGKLIWNRATYVKHPTTGKRLQRPNPESAWIIKDVPALQIIDMEVWEAAKLKQKELSVKDNNAKPIMRPRHLLSQLIVCKLCGSPFSLINKVRYGCSKAKNKGTCSSTISVKKDVLENAVIEIVKHELNNDEAMSLFVKEYTRYINQLESATDKVAEQALKEKLKLEKQKKNIIESIKNGVPADLLRDELISIEEQINNKKLIGVTQKKTSVDQSWVTTRFGKMIGSLSAGSFGTEAFEYMRNLVDKIVVYGNHRNVNADLFINLSGLLPDKNRLAQLGKSNHMVAGAGFEPTTFGL